MCELKPIVLNQNLNKFYKVKLITQQGEVMFNVGQKGTIDYDILTFLKICNFFVAAADYKYPIFCQ